MANSCRGIPWARYATASRIDARHVCDDVRCEPSPERQQENFRPSVEFALGRSTTMQNQHAKEFICVT